jgi:hypothetical protein
VGLRVPGSMVPVTSQGCSYLGWLCVCPIRHHRGFTVGSYGNWETWNPALMQRYEPKDGLEGTGGSEHEATDIISRSSSVMEDLHGRNRGHAEAKRTLPYIKCTRFPNLGCAPVFPKKAK